MIKRAIFNELKEHLTRKEMTLITGPRQAGKTTLMLLLKEFLDERGEKTVFLNLDIEADRHFFDSQDALVRKIVLEIGKDGGYVFIDEIQRKENAGLFLKGIYDMNLGYKFILSGSGSLELKEKIHESLAGRKRIFEVATLSFEEFVNYKTDNRYESKIQDFFSLEREKTKVLLNEYFNYGGYPEVVLAEQSAEKKKIINEIYQSYLEKDISLLLGVKNTEAFSKLIKIIASQTGNLVNVSELSLTLGISAQTVKHYLWYLEKTYTISKVTPYFKNVRKEITKASIYYFYDFGLRNHALDRFGNIQDSQDAGFLFQNVVYHILKKSFQFSAAQIHFWRTKDGSEVDFLIDDGSKIIPIEVKYSEFKKSTIKRSLRSFIEKYHPKTALVITKDFSEEINLDVTKIKFLPFWELIHSIKATTSSVVNI